MNCERAKREVVPYLYGEIEPSVKAELERHLAGCESCSSEMKEVTAVLGCLSKRSNLQTGPQGLLKPGGLGFRRSLLGRLSKWAALGAAAVAAAVLIMALLGTEIRYADGRLTVTISLVPGDKGSRTVDPHLKEWVRGECGRAVSSEVSSLVAAVDESQRRQEEGLLALAEIVDSEVNAELAALGRRIRRVERKTADDLARTSTAIDTLAVAFLDTVEDDSGTGAKGGDLVTTHN